MRNELPYIDNKDLYAAVMGCINNIEKGHSKNKAIKNAAKWKNVKQVDIKPYIDDYFPKSFFAKRKVMPQLSDRHSSLSNYLLDHANNNHLKSI